MKTNPLPPLEFLNECFELDHNLESGLKWRKRPRHHFKNNGVYANFLKSYSGKSVGNKTKKGYFQFVLLFLGKTYHFFTHRIIYAIHNNTIDFLDKFIDHIDRNKSNNNPENLRLVNNQQNNFNKDKSSKNTSGHKGIFLSNRNLWMAIICLNRKKYYLGEYEDIECAISIRARAENIVNKYLFTTMEMPDIIAKIKNDFFHELKRKKMRPNTEAH